MTAPELEALALRVLASGPDRELDVAVHEAFGLKFVMEYWSESSTEKTRNLSYVPRYTTSIDAAMTLVPEGWHLQLADWTEPMLVSLGAWQCILSPPGIRTGRDGLETRCEHAATPALALAAAALRALAWNPQP